MVQETRPTVERLVEVIRASPGWTSKADISVVRDVFGPGDWRHGPGDDGAVVMMAGQQVVACGEAILPAFVEADPYGAGIAAVLTNVNDVAAMGAIPGAVVNTLVGTPELCRAALEGMRYASELYDVPVVGGHLTKSADRVALSAFAVGHCPGPALSAANVAPGQRLGLIVCLDGTMRADFPFFPSFDERGTMLGGDVRMLAELAAAGLITAAKDVSMAGLFGSLAMLLEATRSGVTVNLADVPVPAGVDLARWLICFPCFAFLVTMPPEAEAGCRAVVEARGLTYAPLGEINDSGLVTLTADGATATIVDLSREQITYLGPVLP
jgi:selenophosphate synthetase-related protein